jgi:2-amino-4-hydroxy-6-hydroxymethyldihydropteridine diphosphokinase
MQAVTPVAIALGSNLGDRAAHLRYALSALAPDIMGMKVSRFLETAPVGVEDGQPAYVNAAAAGTTRLSSGQLLARLLGIEQERGRLRPYPMAPRSLDLDLILYGDLVTSDPEMTIPHPRFRERAFVLTPLAEIAPGMRDPVTGLTVAELRDRLADARC